MDVRFIRFYTAARLGWHRTTTGDTMPDRHDTTTRPDPAAEGGEPTRDRQLRAQGRRTMRRLLDAGRDVFAERGFHAARVDDIVSRAETSHGTFYLYFSNKDDLLRALVRDCEEALLGMAARVPRLEPSTHGLDRLREWIAEYDRMYRAYGPVIRAWIEAQPTGTDFARRASDVMRRLTEAFETRIRECGAVIALEPAVVALAVVAMIERYTYLSPTVDEALPREQGFDTLALLVHRGLFGDSGGR